jgi:hypothetical protein
MRSFLLLLCQLATGHGSGMVVWGVSWEAVFKETEFDGGYELYFLAGFAYFDSFL